MSILLLIAKGFEIYDNLNKNLKETLNYLIVGFLTTVVSIVSYNLFRFVISNITVCTILSWICAVLFAYVTNRIFVFKSKSKKIFKEVVSFVSSRLLTLGLEMVIMWFFVTLLKLNSDTWVIVWTIVCQVLVIILNYVFSKLFVFKKGKK